MNCHFKKILALIVLGLLAACNSGVKRDQVDNAANTANTANNAVTSAQSNLTDTANNLTESGRNVITDALDDVNSSLAKRKVYFDYNKYDISLTDKALLQPHADYLKSNPSRRVVIIGNTDERGSTEYNLALGQRRSEAVKQYLVQQGVDSNQIESISHGKEKPVATEHDESAYAQNRRADIDYQR